MSTPAFYDVLHHFKEIHRVVLELAEGLDDRQLNWKPEGYSLSIAFHLWHLARESDFLKAAILDQNPQFVPEYGDGRQVWEKQRLAKKWGFPEALYEAVGTGLTEDAASNLPIPEKEVFLPYLRETYAEIEQFVESLDRTYPTFEGVDDELRRQIELVRLNLLVFLTHDCRHLGMMECLKGLLTGFGSATEKRNR